MITDILSSFPSLYLITAGVFFFAGTIKGVVGIGLPTTALAFLTLVVSPLEAIGLNLMPMIATNLYQFVSAQDIKSIIRTHYRFALIMSAMLLVTASLASGFGNDFIKLMISISILLFCVNNLFLRKWRMREAYDHFWQYSLGCASGLIGGVTSAWGVPITMYLVMKNVTPRQFVDISGFLIIVGCIPVTVGYVATDIFNESFIIPGLIGAGAGLVGFRCGASLRGKIEPALFQKLVLWMFFAMGLRMAYSALSSYGIL